jgi:hypothetical protein
VDFSFAGCAKSDSFRLNASLPFWSITDQRAANWAVRGVQKLRSNPTYGARSLHQRAGGAKDFDLGLYPPGKTGSTTFDKPGVVRILCNAHPDMEAFIVVKEHPFFSSADKGGNYRLNGVPLGKYRIQVWHPELGITETGVELVRAGEILDVNFDLKKK